MGYGTGDRFPIVAGFAFLQGRGILGGVLFRIHMPFQIYNTLTRKKEDFVPADPKAVKFYLCGPTVYNFAHIGNLYAYVSADLLLRSLRAHGYVVNAVMNLTDVDDKTIRGTVAQAAATGEKATVDGLKRFTQKYADIFRHDLKKLGCDQFDVTRRVTEVMPEMISITQKLLANGTAYLAPDGSVYYSVAKAKNYGELAHLDFSGMKAGARVDNDEYAKDSAADFALWKAYDASKDGEIYWDAQFTIDGQKKIVRGRPGWHIECSAMNLAEHGEQIDLHMGGVDLIFPHHQNEIAQTEGVTGKQFCRCWAHSGHVMENGKRMAKRDGGFVTLRTLEEKYPGKERVLYRAYRMMCAQSHYRQGFDFSWEKLEAAMRTVEGLDNLFKRLATNRGLAANEGNELAVLAQKKEAEFLSKIADDLDMPGAVAVLFAFASDVNAAFDSTRYTATGREACVATLRKFASALPVFDFSLLDGQDVPADVTEMVTGVMAAKVAKNWAEVDALRAQALSKGWKIVDQKDRTSRAERA